MTIPDLIPLGFWCLVAGLAFGFAAMALHVAEVRAVNATAGASPTPDPGLWLPCHSPVCAHLTTPHDPAPTGPACRHCGTTNGGQQ